MKVSPEKIKFFTAVQICSAVLGLGCGYALRHMFDISPTALAYIEMPGKLLVRYCRMLIVPLVMVSLSSSLANIKLKSRNRLLFWSFGLIIVLSTFVSVFGLILVSIIRPGSGAQLTNVPSITQKTRSHEFAVYDVLMSLAPDNIVTATFLTQFTAQVPGSAQNSSSGSKTVLKQTFSTNTLGICTFSIVFGLAILDLGNRVKVLKHILDETNIIIRRILRSFVIMTPFGMFCWMIGVGITAKMPEAILPQLAWFTFSVVLSFAFVWLIIYPLIYYIALRKNPFRLYYNILSALMVAFGSNSSTVALPVTMIAMEKKHKLAKHISNFVLPLGISFHMPGSFVYFPMIVMFVAQVYEVSVPFGAMLPLCFYVIMLVMALPGPAGGGHVLIAMVCEMLGVDNPMVVIGFCGSIDWIIGRMRTITNVMGDCVIASIVEKYYDDNEREDDTQTNQSDRSTTPECSIELKDH